MSQVKSLDNLWARISGDTREQYAEIKAHTQRYCPLEANLLLWDKARARGLTQGWVGHLGLVVFATQNPQMTNWILAEERMGLGEMFAFAGRG